MEGGLLFDVLQWLYQANRQFVSCMYPLELEAIMHCK